jgi:2-polyprenyl-3-methyl-5-hydroxy-6-metoxy-1,4-benzoquinol methylase
MGARAEGVTYVKADLFEWEPRCRYDAVVFCFWISHVPEERFDGFLRFVAEALRHRGKVFFVDGRRQPDSTAVDHELPEPGSELMVRRLNDGRTYRIVKNFRASLEIEARCRSSGLEVTVSETPRYFQYGSGHRVYRHRQRGEGPSLVPH